MLKRTLVIFALLFAGTLARADDAPQPAPAPPTIIVRLASLDTLFDHFKLVGGLVGKEDLGKKLDEAIKSKLGPKGLHGIDGKRPIGLYARVGADISDINGVLMVPVTGAKRFKEMLEGLGWEVSTDKTGLFTVKQNLIPMDVQYRLANDYAYVGLLGQNTLAPAGLMAPDKIFNGPQKAALSLTLRLDQIPAGVRDMILDGIKDGLGKIEEKPGESKAQQAFRVALTKEVLRILERVLKDGDELNALIDIELKTKQLAVELTLAGKAQSKLADNIAKLGQRQTLFAGVLDKDAAMNGLVNLELPAELRGALGGLVEETAAKVLAEITDPSKKKQATQLLEALKPSLTAGEIDAAFSLRGPSKTKHFTLIAGFKLKEGDKLAGVLVELIKDLPEKERKAIQLNVDKAGGTGIHRLDLQSSFDAIAKQMFGDQPVFVAIRNDALFLAVGEEGLPALRQALTTTATVAAPLQFDMSLARFGAAMDKNAAAAQMAQKLIAAGDDARLRITLEGGPVLRVRFTMGLSALQVFSQQK
jgi:hypothetical protein